MTFLIFISWFLKFFAWGEKEINTKTAGHSQLMTRGHLRKQ